MAAIGIVKGWQSRRRPGRLEGIVKVTVLADVIKLMADHSAVAMHSVGNLAEMRNDLVGGMAEIATGENGGAMHRHGLNDYHAGTATGAFFVVATVAFTGQPLLRHIGGV